MPYRKKFIISIYDMDDQLITVLDNIKEFARLFDKTYDQARFVLSSMFMNKSTYFYYNKKRYYASFIED